MGFITGIKVALGARPNLRDPHEADEDAARIRGALERADLGQCVELLRQVRGGAWEDRHFFCEVVAKHADLDALDRLCQSDRRNAIPFLLRAARGITLAWEARSADDTMTSGGWEVFKHHMRHSRNLLATAARLDPVDPTPHVYMLTVARGLRLSAAVARDHFDKAVAREPMLFPAHEAMVELLSPMWGGSYEALFEFARGAVQGIPEGTELWLVLLLAHIERWRYAFVMEGDEEAASAWVASPETQAEVLHAHGMSLASDWHIRGRYTPQRRNEVAFWFHLSGDRQRLRHELSELGPVCAVRPWCYLGEPREIFRAARKAAGLS